MKLVWEISCNSNILYSHLQQVLFDPVFPFYVGPITCTARYLKGRELVRLSCIPENNRKHKLDILRWVLHKFKQPQMMKTSITVHQQKRAISIVKARPSLNRQRPHPNQFLIAFWLCWVEADCFCYYVGSLWVHFVGCYSFVLLDLMCYWVSYWIIFFRKNRVPQGFATSVSYCKLFW